MDTDVDGGNLSFVIPARTLTGNVAQLLMEIDDTIDALQAIREVVVARAPKPAKPPQQHWWTNAAHAVARLVVRPDGPRIDSRPMAR